jgi:pinin
MAGISSVVTALQQEFELAKKDLSDVDQNIRKLTGREPGLVVKGKAAVQTTARRSASQLDQDDGYVESDDPKRRRFTAFSKVNRVHSSHEYEEESPITRKPTIASSVVANIRPQKPRTQALEEQKSDSKGMARNRRMFGMILGTLQRFQSDEGKRKETTQRRQQIEKKVDKVAEDEKSAVVKERKELFKNRRNKQAELRKVQFKMERVEVHQDWERSHQHLGSFIRTRTKPYIFYMPKKLTSETEKRLTETKETYRLIVAEKRAKVQKELADIDECYRKEVEDDDGQDDIEEMDDVQELSAQDESTKNEVFDRRDEKVIDDDNGTQICSNQDSEAKVEPMEDSSTIETSDTLAKEKDFEPIYDE